jgi:electron transport complex protein RnfG
LAGVNELTAERIAEQERRVVLEQLGQIISPDRYDNRLQEDLIVVEDESYFPRGQSVTVYRARQDGEPTALVMKLAAVNGYNGMIRLLVGINADGSLSGVRVASHKETPGLGDAIEIERSDWVLGFNQRSLQDPSNPGWAVKRDGGKFDQFTGATITPRAVVEAVRLALEYYQRNQALLFEVQAQGSPVEET